MLTQQTQSQHVVQTPANPHTVLAPVLHAAAFPRLVKHVDDGFLAQVTQLYRERIQPGKHVQVPMLMLTIALLIDA